MAAFVKHIGYYLVRISVTIDRSGLTADAVSSMLSPIALDGRGPRCPNGKVQRIS
jgi:hypothetical protein